MYSNVKVVLQCWQQDWKLHLVVLRPVHLLVVQQHLHKMEYSVQCIALRKKQVLENLLMKGNGVILVPPFSILEDLI